MHIATLPGSIHGVIEGRATARPEARALLYGGEVVSYGALDERANRLAHHLVAHGVGPEVIVGIHIERSIELVVAMLAVLKAGGAYLPLDPSYPAERNAFMAKDCGARLVITNAPGRTGELAPTRIDLSTDAAAIAREPGTRVARDVDAANLAYVIYTSGSTGTPKGVLISHDRVNRLMSSTQAWFGFDERDVWTFFHSYAFDFSVWELWGALIYGGSVVIVPEAVRRSPDELLELLSRQKVTVLNQIPSAFRQLIATATRGATPASLALRYVIFGGEALDLRSLAPWFARYPAPTLVNMYGITETTVHATYRVIDPAECLTAKGSPIGVPIPDLEVHLLDGTFAPVRAGEEGEIHIGGAGLARGYHDRPGLTAERFLPDPFSRQRGARLYRSGDLARRIPDGSLEYLGRNDHQVKIRGYRIETGEISSILATHREVREAVVVARAVDEGDRRLVAYVVLGSATPAEELRDFLGDKLPAYMIPAAFVAIDSLPITPSGKLDTQALPDPDGSALAGRTAYVAPQTAEEQIMAALWSRLMGVARIGRDDRFFELGGHSLLAAQVASRLSADHGVAVPIRLFLASPSLAEAARAFAEILATQAGRGAREARRVPQRPQVDRAPISFAQESIWVHEQVLQDVLRRGRAYVECPVLQIQGPVVASLLERALNEIAARHEIWRTSFVLEDEPIQRIGRSARIPLRLHDRRGLTTDERRQELETIADSLATPPFVPARAPLVRCALVTFADDAHALILMMHHLVTDAWSENLIAAELARLYGFLAAGQPLPPRTEVEVQYGDYAAWERSEEHARAREKSRTFWRDLFAHPPEPLSLARAKRAEGPAARAIRVTRRLDADVGQRLSAFCRQHNVSSSATLQAALAVILSSRASGGRFVLGVANANRTRASEELPGCFTGVLPLIVELADEPTFETIARRMMTSVADAVPHGGLPLPEIARLVGPNRGATLVQVQASTQLAASRYEAGPVSFVQDYVPVNDPKFALELVIQELDDRSMVLTWIGDPAIFEAAAVEQAADALDVVLAAALEAPARPIDELAPHARAWTNRRFTEGGANTSALVPALIEAQVDRTPDATAVVFEGTRLTYRELDARANQLAHHLLAQGARADEPIAVVFERSLEMVVAVLGITKAGAPYLPIDPTHPEDRLRTIISDAKVRLLVGPATGADLAGRLGVVPVSLEAEHRELAGCPVTRPAVGLLPGSLAYVIYTSGSTGRPKGVMNTHAGLRNRLVWMQDAFALGPEDVVLQKTPYTFDVSVWEFFWPLMTGASLVVARPEGHRDPAYLSSLVERERVTTLHFVPSMLEAFLEHGDPGAWGSVRQVFCSGEALAPAHQARFYEASKAALVNLYGPTEASIDVSVWRCPREAGDRTVPIGRPIANTTLHVVDAQLQPAPLGTEGELYIGGVQLARGYLGRADLTAERFVPDPFGAPGSRLYRTGDLTRMRPDGAIEFLGRLDHQVKLHGFRIELGEIESVLAEHRSVRQAVVILRDERLIAYVVRGEDFDAATVSAHVASKLPPFMVPSALVALEALPLTTSGKVDRRALPDWSAPAGAEVAPLAPRTAEEAAIATLWAEILRVDRVGVRDHFFEIGGHSLLAIRLVARLREAFGVELSLAQFFDAPTIESLAAVVQRMHASSREPSTPSSAPPEATQAPSRVEAAEGTEHQIAAIFAEVLELPTVGLHDSFFELGGHSILAAHAVARLEETFGMELPLRTIFEVPTAAGLAHHVRPQVPVSPRTPRLEEMAQTIARAIAEILELPSVGPQDDFFDLGGHSILAAYLVARIEELLGVELPLRTLFETPTALGLATLLLDGDEQARGEDPITEVVLEPERGEDIPLSYPQQRLWFLHQLAPDTAAYNLSYARRLRGPLDGEALRRAIEAVIHHHDALRTTFPARDGVPRQALTPAVRWPLPFSDLSAVPAGEREAEIARLVEADVDLPFDLGAHPPLRARLVRASTEDHVLVVTMHHIISDARSLDVFWRDVRAAYIAFTRGARPALHAVPVRYAAYAKEQRERLSGAVLERQLAYWTTQLEGAPAQTDLPYRSARPRVSTAPPREVVVDLGPPLSNELRALARRNGTTLFMTCLAAVRAVLTRAIGQDDLCIGAPISNRSRPELNGVVGLFVNTLVFRTRVDPEASFTELLHRERDSALDAFSHQETPFELIVQALGIERGAASNPLFQVSFAHQVIADDPVDFGLLRDEPYDPHRNAAQFDLEVETWERGESIEVRFSYKQDLFEHEVIAGLAKQLACFVRGVVRDPVRRVSRVPLLEEPERRRLVTQWNRPDDQEVPDTTLVALIEAQVDRTPDATAVVLGAARATYRQLDERANRIAASLRALAVTPEKVVGIALERSLDLVAAILGVLKAGGAWVPLDPKLPAARLRDLVETSRPTAIVSTAELARGLPALAIAVLDVTDPAVAAASATRGAPVGISGDSLAYVIFTSGSTGQPKGVMVSHRAVANELARSNEALGRIDAGDALLQLAPYTFDQFVHEMFWPLVNGATLVLLEEGEQRDPARVIQRVQAGQVTIVETVPTLLRALISEPGVRTCSSLRLVALGGEALSLDLMRAWFAVRPDVPLGNGYGPTETAITVCHWRCQPDAPRTLIGAAWRNVSFYVLDAHQQPVALGLGGELYIGGGQLARGYVARPDLTAERFVPDPFSPVAGRRMYRTGDRVRQLPDGTLEFLGRVDEQIKLRGFRIELGEIEAALRAHPAVAACAVVTRPHPGPGPEGRGDQLVAYVVAREPIAVAVLRAHLGTRLPEYMVPAAYVVLDALPLTTSGKLDRRALPAPGAAAFGRDPDVAPRTTEETAIAAIWAEVLGVDAVGVLDGFFALGGHSLLATQVISRVRAELAAPVTLQHLFDAPTVAGLAAQVVRLSGGPAVAAVDAGAPAPRGDELELSYAQQRLWLLDRMFPDRSAYHIPSGKRIRGALDHEALRRAFEELIHRHEVLRTVFPASGGLPRQRILPPGSWELPLEDLSGLPEVERHNQLHRISREDAERPFDLEAGPVLRTTLVRLAATDHVLLVTMHHIVSDGWSVDLLWRELMAFYDGHRAGRPLRSPPLRLQYADVAAQQRTTLTADVLAGHLGFWKQYLAGAPPETALPRKAARPTTPSGRSEEVAVELDEDATRAVRELGQREGASLFMTLLAAFRAVVARTTGEDDLVIGTPIANRDREELQDLIGLFVNTIALRTEVDRVATFAELVRHERASALAAFAHQDAPFEMIVDELGVERRPGLSPIFQIWFVQETVPEVTIPIDRDLGEEAFHRGLLASKFDLAVYINERRGGVELALTFDPDLFDRHVIEGIARRFARALELGARSPDRSFAELDLGDASDSVDPRVALDRPAYPPVLQVIEELVVKDPAAPALRHGDRTLARGELWTASSGVASALVEAGVGPGHRVALAGPPSAGLIAGFLGILRSGACLVPLSSRLARENADRLLELADARVVLEVSSGAARTHARVPTATIDAVTGAVTMPAALAIPSRPADPAVKYIYFTSGTTGAQKGVIGDLVALAHFSAWQRSMFGGAAGPVSAQLTELGFDVFLRDTMFALTAGKLMALPPKAVFELEPAALLRWMERERVTAIHTVPSLARSWLDDCPPDVNLRELRCIFVVGEPLDAALVERWRTRFYADTEFINLYGTTETGPAKCWYRVPHPPEPGVQPIGWPLPETQILLLRDDRHLAAAGEVGEIVIRTPFSTLGYLDRTRGEGASYVPNPFGTDPADLLYRTGDLGRQRLDGAVDILGRLDDQVKIRGQRVDPPGIAAALRAHGAVMDAAVIAHELDQDDVRLVAYVVRSEPPPSTSELRELLRQTIPPYMIPTSFVFLDTLPKKPNGKLDRAALPAPEWDGGDGDAFMAPRGPEEEAIAAIWCEVLGLARVSVRDNFFAIGGHSLLAVLVTSRVRALLEVDLGIQRFFEAPTVEGVAANVVRLRSGATPVAPDIEIISRSEVLPLSFAQQRMWFLHRLAPTSPAYHVPLVRRLRGALAPEALRRSFEEVVRRHESLRSVFPSHAGVPLQKIREPQRWELPIDDLSQIDPVERDAAVEQHARAEAERPFDLAAGPLLRTRLVKLAADDHLLLVTLHHIVSDGWSMGVLWTELSELYGSFTTGMPARLPPLAIQYPDFAAWQRKWLAGATLDQQLAYWTTKLADAPSETAMPIKGPRPAVPSSRGGLVEIELGEDLVTAMRTLNKQSGATQFVTLLAAFRAVLSRITGQDDLCIGTPIANRGRKEVEHLIGLMLNTLVLRTEVAPNATFVELVRAERATALEAYAHQEAPFEMIVDALAIERSLTRTPLFQVLFVNQNLPQPLVPIGELVDEPFATKELTTRFDLSVVSFERDQKLAVELVYNQDLFDRWQVEQLAAQFVEFLRNALRDPNVPVARIPAFDDRERERLLVEWNRTPGEVSDTTIPALFETQVDRTPDSIALVLGTAQLSYRELDERANQIAWALRERGVGPESIVGISLERSFDLVAAILGVSKAGGAWVPLDPQLPASRLAYIADVARPRLVISTSALAARMAPLPAPVVDLDAPALGGLPRTRPGHVGLSGDHLAYVLFTSGSTGRPKGVMIPHRGIVNELVSAQTLRAQLDGGDAFLQLAPCTFDLSVHEILWPLSAGARVVLLPEGDHRDPRRIADEIRARNITILHPVPTVLRALLADHALEGCTSLRTMCSGGEAMPLEVLQEFTRCCPGVMLVNSYGPTETSVTVSQWRCSADATAVAIGTPWIDTQMVALDARLEPVPLGIAGELYVGGRQVGRGYAGQPGLTAERFVPDPFSTVPGRRMYRTGDRVRRWPDGNLEILGRIDKQVKLRGFRIELGEIEAVLREHGEVREAAVVIDGEGSEARLVAYVVHRAASIDPLRAHLAARLPEYMVPKLFVRLEAMPLTRSGKVDRALLPTPDDSGLDRRAVEPPRTPVEEILAGIWSELLGVEHIGRRDDFFDLGGHSLLAARLAWEAKVSIATVFAAPTLAELALAIEASSAERESGAMAAPPIVRVERGEHLAPSFAQQRMWFLHQLAPESPAYHIALGRRLRGSLDVEALRGAIEDLVARHESLRTVFPAPAGILHQEVREPATIELPLRELSAATDEHRAAELEALSRSERERPFDLVHGPLVRSLLVRAAADEHALLITMHHIVADGFSVGVLWHELEHLYSARVHGRRAALAPLELQYADYATWQRTWFTEEVLERQLEYWKERLGGAPEETALPVKGPRPAIQTYRGASLSIHLDPELVAQLRALSRQHGSTLFITLLAGLRALLYRYTGQDDVCIGAPTANRNLREIEPLIGLFVNTMVLRTPAGGQTSFADLLNAERTTALEAFSHGEAPFEMVVEALGVVRTLSRNPLFQVMFQLQFVDGADAEAGFAGLVDTAIERGSIATPVDLDVSALVSGDGIELLFVYNIDLFERATVDQLAQHLRALLGAAVAEPDLALAALPIVPQTELDLLLTTWNRAERAVPRRALPELIEEGVERAPDAIAVTSTGGSITYRMLSERSNQLARHLLRLGLRAEERVGICLERGPDLIVAMLGVLKAGGAYVPLDGELPPDRLAYMASDAGVRILLTQPDLAGRVTVEISVDVDFAAGPIANESTADPGVALAPDQLAYVLYTSGSTGRPKGVQIQHGSLVNFLVSMQDAPGMTERDVLLAVTTASFDISGLELYLPLLAGARVVIAGREAARDAERLPALLQDTGATVMQATPSTWRLLVESGWSAPPGFTALCGGEALPPDLAAALVPRVAALWNLYGPTETTIWSARKRIEHGAPIRLGEPIANTRLYVVDPESLGVQPLEVTGELLIAGDGLARGYGGRPGLTAERFVPDPYATTPGGRMYRTGDLVRRRAGGELEFLGRIDHQVKIRGFRIELGEIEAVIADHPSVVEVVVVVREDNGDPRLVAYIVTIGTAPAAEAVLAGARERLPDYMVPSAVVVLDSLPLSPAGKIDRRALPPPDRIAFSPDELSAPRTPVEEVLVGIWCDLLDIAQLGVHQDFFAVGGHSLLAIRLVAEVERAFAIRIPLRQVFLGPTVREMASDIQSRQAGDVADRPELSPTETRLTRALPPQRGTYLLDRYEPLNATNRLTWSMRLEGPLEVDQLERALAAMRQRHAILRSRFFEDDGALWIEDLAELEVPVLQREDLSSLSDAEQEQREPEFYRSVMMRPFDLGRGEVMRAALAVLSPTRHWLVVCVHRIVCDNLETLVRELAQLWRALSEDPSRTPSEILPPISVQYLDLADYLVRVGGSSAGLLHRAFWEKQLVGAEALELPLDRSRDEVETRRLETSGFITFPAAIVSAELTHDDLSAVELLARTERATVQSTLLAGLAAHLHQLTGQQDLAFMSHLTYRYLPGFENAIGLFANPLVMRISAAGAPTFGQLVTRAHASVMGAFEHGECDVLGLADYQLFRLCFNYMVGGAQPRPHELPAGLSATDASLPPRAHQLAYDLMLRAYNHGSGVTLDLFYNQELFREQGARALLEGYVTYLRASCLDPAAPLATPNASL